MEKVKSKRKMTKPKSLKIQNDKNIPKNLKDVHILNDVEKGVLCGPENSGHGKIEATNDGGGGSEPEEDEKEEDSDAESWADTRVKGWLRPRVKTRRMNESAPESFWRQGTSGPRAVMFPEATFSDPAPHSQITCRSCRFDAKMSSSANAADNANDSRSPGPPSAGLSPSASSPPAEDSSSSSEPLGLGEGEEFVLVKVSHTKKKCWATFLNDDPEHQCDGHGHFALSASVEDILERRRQHHAILDAEARQKARQGKSPDRDYGFSNLNVREQGEKPSPGIRQAAKSAPHLESSSSETLNPDW